MLFTIIGACVSAFLTLGVTLALLDGGSLAGPGVVTLLAVLIGPLWFGRLLDRRRS